MSTIYNKASDIALELSSRLAGITKANGFGTDIGLRVLRGRRTVDDSQVPCSVLIEGEDSIQSDDGTSVKLAQRYVLGGYVECDPDAPNDAAHLVLRDIKRAIFKPVELNGRVQSQPGITLGGRVLKVSYQGRDIGPRADGVPIVFAVVQIDVHYVEDLSNP